MRVSDGVGIMNGTAVVWICGLGCELHEQWALWCDECLCLVRGRQCEMRAAPLCDACCVGSCWVLQGLWFVAVVDVEC